MLDWPIDDARWEYKKCLYSYRLLSLFFFYKVIA